AQKGLKPTDAEYQLVAEGKLAEMWEGRCAAGDPIGCVGFATWGSMDDVQAFFGGGIEADHWVNLGTTVRINARTGLLEGNPFLRSGNGRAYLPWIEKQMGKAIANAHLNATSTDLTNRHYFLSAPEITSYHHAVFDKFNVGRQWYGGSYMTGNHSRLLEPFYCQPSCDSY
ncbi:MAG: hypothetical protein K0U59_12540, partial [Gammaproteobacteria bacterium]|nr:hypothetical protein [Gammaproteobacteria bacterium]